ncbi:MAG: hypothetical protein WA947_18340 [Phormidesmis sp.]
MTNDELKALCESNAKAIQAQGVSIAEVSTNVDRLSNTVAAFIDHVDSEGLRVSIIQESADDTASETVELERRANYSEAAVEALRRDAIEDRKEWRAGFDEIQGRADENQQQWQANYDAQLAEIRALGEQNRALLSALATTNRRVDDLEQAS